MTDWQILREMKSLIGDRVWPDGTGDPVVGTGGVVISSLTPDELIGSIAAPFVILTPGNVQPDRTSALWRQSVEIVVVQEVEGDETGESGLIGSARENVGESEGRGLLEIQAQVLAAVGFKTAAVGLPRFSLIYGSGAEPTFVGRTSHMMRRVVLQTTTTVQETYAAPRDLVAADSGGGASALTWTNPPSRYDFYQVRVQRAAGSTAPASATAGTNVYTGTDESVADTPGTGAFSYSIWAAYDETNSYDGGTASAEQRYSDQVTGTTSTVTVT